MKKRPQTKREVIVETWKRRRSPAVGEKELRHIQRALGRRLGAGAIPSPATIARVLADDGAELRHPEVIEFDARWREKEIQKRTKVDPAGTADKPLTLARVARLIDKLERSRRRLERKGDQASLRSLRELAITQKELAQSLARGPRLGDQSRSEQAEIVEWLRVWLQTPNLFSDWLDLRRQTSDFRKKFMPGKP